MSKYDNIKTAADLIKEVQMHGLSLNQDDLNRAADIFGHTAIDELVSLANDIGRDNGNGEPDPKGSWSSGRRETRSTFYQIASNIWSFEDVTRFWNQYTNPEHEELKKVKTHDEYFTKRFEDVNEQLKEAAKMITDYQDKAFNLEKAVKEKDMEIMKLKAMLFDYMSKQ